MPIKTPKKIEVPKSLKDAISIGQKKVEVLRDEELRLSKIKSLLEKDVAQLTLDEERLSASVPNLEELISTLNAKIDGLEGTHKEAIDTLHKAEEERKSVVKDAKAAAKEAVEAKKQLSKAVEAAREAKTAIDAEKAALDEKTAAFVARVSKVRELLNTI